MSKVFIEESTLSAIGNAIREKTGKSDLIGPLNMAAEISSITTGGSGEEFEIPEITGDGDYMFANNGWNWFIEQFGNKIQTKDLIGAANMFYYSTRLENIPFDINFKPTSSDHLCNNMFADCHKLTNVPKVNNAKPSGAQKMFQTCYLIQEVPDDFCDTWDWSYIETATSTSTRTGNNMFGYCYSLRSFPMEILSHDNQNLTSYSSTIYYGLFTYDYALDEVINLPVHYRDKGITSNMFSSAFDYCSRLKNLTFAVQEDGTPYTAKWKSQTIDLSKGIGWASYVSNILNYNSGITADKQVTDDATYEALKNDPDWWTINQIYSRYNHDSAVATLNSLPDTSAYGTNTIKFKGTNGSSTIGGAINTLTQEEIAVATAKGWTVTLV